MFLSSLKIIRSYFLYLGICDAKYLSDIYRGKDTFQAVKQAYIVGCNRINKCEEIMEKELHSRSEYNYTRTDPFWYGAL